MSSISLQQFGRDSKRLVDELIKISDNVKKDSKRVFEKAAVPLIDEIQRRAPVSKQEHYRYKSGQIVATYSPGNLRRSIRILRFRRSAAVWVGPKRDKTGGGSFKGSRADGYYAHFVEYGVPSHGQAPRPFVRPAVQAARFRVLQIAMSQIRLLIRKYR